MKVCFFDNEKAAPVPAERTPADLVLLLSEFRRGACTSANCAGDKCPHKYGPAWAPIELLPGAIDRRASSIAAVTAAVFDLDGIPDDLGWMAQILNQGLACTLHSSHRHTPSEVRLRLIIWLDEPVPAAHWTSFWGALVALYDIPCDPACKDVSRLYFLPSAPIGAETEFRHFPGRELCTADILAKLGPAAVAAATTPAPPPRPAGPLPARDIANTLIPHWPKKGRHLASLALSGGLARQGWDRDAIAECTTLIGAAVNGDDGEPQKRLRQAEDSIQKVIEGRFATGFTSLKTFGIPECVIDCVQVILSPQSEIDAFRDALNLKRSTGPDLLPATSDGDTDPDEMTLHGFMVDSIKTRALPPIRLYSTGVPALDALTGGGFATGYIWTTLAPPGSGKSAWLINAALAVEGAPDNSAPVLLITTELDAREYVARFDAHLSDVAWRDIVTGEVKASRLCTGRRIAIVEYADLPHTTEDALAFIAKLVEVMKAKYGVAPIVMMDYLQDFANRAHADFRVGVSLVSRALLTIAKQHDCAVVLVSSVSRAWYGQAKAEAMRTPTSEAGVYMSAGKESGGIDFDSAVVMFIDLEQSTKLARFAVAKARRGDTGFIGMEFFGASGRWVYKPEALNTLSAPGKNAKKVEESQAAVDTIVLEHIRKLDEPGLMTGNQLVAALEGTPNAASKGGQLSRKEILGAVLRLKTRNLIVLRENKYTRSRHLVLALVDSG